MRTEAEPAPSLARRAFGWLQVALTIAIVAFWFFELRPQALGGPASFALVNGESMLPNYHTGDVVIVHRQAHYRIGDLISYRVPKGQAGAGAEVIHRLVGGDPVHGWLVQGDNRTAPDVWHPHDSDIVGSEWAHVPNAGIVVRILHTPIFLAALAALAAMGFVFRRTDKAAAPEEAEVAVAAGPVPEPEAEAPAAAPARVPVTVLPAGSVLCSRGCHVLATANFDPHTGEPVVYPEAAPAAPVVEVASEPVPEPEPEPEPVPAPGRTVRIFHDGVEIARRPLAEPEPEPEEPVEAEAAERPEPLPTAPGGPEVDRLLSELARISGSSDEVRETMRELVGAIGEYGEHLRSHTAVMENLASSTNELKLAAIEMRAVLGTLAHLLAQNEQRQNRP